MYRRLTLLNRVGGGREKEKCEGLASDKRRFFRISCFNCAPTSAELLCEFCDLFSNRNLNDRCTGYRLSSTHFHYFKSPFFFNKDNINYINRTSECIIIVERKQFREMMGRFGSCDSGYFSSLLSPKNKCCCFSNDLLKKLALNPMLILRMTF